MSRQPRNIFIISTWSLYEPLAQSYLLPYIFILKEVLPVGSQIHFLTLEKNRFAMDHQVRTTLEQSFKSQNIHWHRHGYIEFSLRAALNYSFLIMKICLIVKRDRIEVLHPFAPVAGAIAQHVRKFTRSKVVLDSWEPHAESMVESGVWKRDSFAFRYLFRTEKELTEHADFLIAANEGMREYAQRKWNLKPKRVAIRPACVDTSIFDRSKFDRELLRKELGYENKMVAICTGKLTGMYLGKEVIQFLSDAYQFFGERFRACLLTETPINLVEQWCKEIGLPMYLLRIESVEHAQIPKFLAMADFAINPQKPLPSKRYGTPVKDGEYWAMGLPVIIPPDISSDSDIVSREKVGVVWSTRQKDNAVVLKQLDELLQDEEMLLRCIETAKKYRGFNLARKAYVEIYSTI